MANGLSEGWDAELDECFEDLPVCFPTGEYEVVRDTPVVPLPAVENVEEVIERPNPELEPFEVRRLTFASIGVVLSLAVLLYVAYDELVVINPTVEDAQRLVDLFHEYGMNNVSYTTDRRGRLRMVWGVEGDDDIMFRVYDVDEIASNDINIRGVGEISMSRRNLRLR